jgi:hypothetical protein
MAGDPFARAMKVALDPVRLLLTPRHRAASNLEGQLVFSLKWEGVAVRISAAAC